MKNIRFPFELPTPECELITVSPQVASVMYNGTTQERQAIELIAEHWTKIADKAIADGLPEPDFGIKIPRRYGFTATEREVLEDTSAQERQQMISALELVKKISSETGIPVSEVQKEMAKAESGQADLSLIEPYIDEILNLKIAAKVDIDLLSATIFVRRAIPKWTPENTKNLHPEIRQQLTDFWYLENSRGENEKKSTILET